MSDPNYIAALKYSQVLNATGVFFIPSMLYIWLIDMPWKLRLGVGKKINLFPVIAIALLVLAALPLENYLGELNQSIRLPESLVGLESWMQEMESSAEETILAFLEGTSITTLMVNLFILAILPALGEELLFRGILQPAFIQNARNVHVGIWTTAFLFSAFHLQFYGFIPRLIMGAGLGYIAYWSRSLWFPIIAHFINNAMAVFLVFFIGLGSLPEGTDQTGAGSFGFFSVSLVACMVLLFGIRRYFQTEGN